MKNDIRDYKGLSEDDKKYLREFDNAVERGYFANKKVKISEDMKKSIGRERYRFRKDIMTSGKRGYADFDNIAENERVFEKKKRKKAERDPKTGKFKSKEVK